MAVGRHSSSKQLVVNSEELRRSRVTERDTGAISPIEMMVLVIAPVALLLAAWRQWWALPVVESLGFASGAICVWLVVRENIWNWPIGLANNVFFFVLFSDGRLFADAVLQVVYFALGSYGWWNWRYGGAARTELTVSRVRLVECVLLLVAIPLGILGVRELLIVVQGAAPLWDSITTVLSLAAQYLLSRKRLENWLLWIVADVIYVPLYLSRGLGLTAVLYFGLLIMCLFGGRTWFLSWRRSTREIA